MPEAAIHEDHEAFPRPSKIRRSRQLEMPTPSLEAIFSQNRGKAQFGSLVSLSLDAPHDLGALRRGRPDGGRRICGCKPRNPIDHRHFPCASVPIGNQG